MENKVIFIEGDVLEIIREKECFDFIYWNNFFYYMLDVEVVIKWSYEVFEKDGMFYMDDYVGFNRM